jgi:hypothetical protein
LDGGAISGKMLKCNLSLSIKKKEIKNQIMQYQNTSGIPFIHLLRKDTSKNIIISKPS